MKAESHDKLCDDNWVQDLAYMVDITWHLIDLNLKLQGKDSLSFHCMTVLRLLN